MKHFRLSIGHKHLIVTLALLVVVLVQAFGGLVTLPKLGMVTYAQTKTNSTAGIVEAQINARAEEIYIEREMVNREHARIEAIQEAHEKLKELIEISPYVDYTQLRQIVGAIQ